MHAFDFIVLLFSFVYAAAVAQILGTTGEIVIASDRLQISWLNAGWMLLSLLVTCAWWIGLWDLREIRVWTTGLTAFFFAAASLIYVLTRMVSPRIPHEGKLDIVAFHRGEGRKYIGFYACICLLTIGTNSLLGPATGAIEWPAQNLAVTPMFVAAIIAAIFIRTIWVQAAAILIEMVAWAVYFAFLQPPLSG
jgi:hypothetical protein